jgi:hypothetical protein
MKNRKGEIDNKQVDKKIDEGMAGTFIYVSEFSGKKKRKKEKQES